MRYYPERMATSPAASGAPGDRLTDTEWNSVLVECLEQGFSTDFDPAEETKEILGDPVWLELLEEAESDLAAGKGVPMLRAAEH